MTLHTAERRSAGYLLTMHTDTIEMSQEEIRRMLDAHKPRPDRPGLWEFRHHDGGTEEIRLREREDEWTDQPYLAPVTDMPSVPIEEMLMAGAFTRYLGP